MVGKPAKTLTDKVKLSQLRTLMAVAKTGSFSEAAFRLDVSQSTVSHSIAALEEALGVVLVHRGRQGATLTPVGDRIYIQAKQALSLIEVMGQEASRARGTEGGQVRIAAFRSMASEILPEAIARLHVHHPTIQISILEFESLPAIMNALREGQADCSVASLLEGDEFETFHMMEDPFVALLPPGRNDLHASLSWEDLRKQPLITSSNDCCHIIRSYLNEAQPSIDVDYLIAHDSTAVSMTRQGLGITLLPKLAALPIPPEVRVAQLPFEISRPLGISWLKASWLTPAAYAFLDVFKALIANHADQANPTKSPVKNPAKQAIKQAADFHAAADGNQRYGVEHEKTAISAAGYD